MGNMTTEQKELLQSILANKEFLAEILKAATETKPKKLPKMQIGDTITIAGIVWRKFKEDGNGNSYVLADDIIKSMKFGETNDWRKSPIRLELDYLANDIRKEIGENALVSITTDLFSHDGLSDYITCEDYVSLFTYDDYRYNRKNIKQIDKAYWLATPNSTPSGCGSDVVQYVCSCGSVSYDWCGGCYGVRPFCILSSLIFES